MKAPGLTRTRRTFFAPIWVALLSAVILTLLLLAAVRVSLYLFSTTTTVVLVRHAEKAPPESGPDPVLSAEGQERALRLARLLGEADVAAVYASDTRRAQLTASPLAARLGVTVTTRPGSDIEGLLDDIGEHHQGERVVVIPYVMPGFQLARLCAELFPAQAGPQTIGMVLLNHGIFTFGATAQQSYTRMIELVTQAEEFLQRQQAWQIALPAQQRSTAPARTARAALRRQLSAAAGAPLLLSFADDDLALHFARHPQVETIAQQGPATPDHVIRTKRLPLVGRDVQSYVDAYRAYFAQHQSSSASPLTMLDPAPRVLVDPEWGLGAVGRTAKEAAIAAEIYRHTMQIILRAELLGGYRALSAADLFEMEYWDLEQAKLRRPQKQPPFTGEVALVTGAASGIGRACAESFLARGAAVIGLDLNPAITGLWRRPDFLGIQCDVTDGDAVEAALEKGVQRFGGIDMVVLNAGIFPPGRRIAALSSEDWRRVLAINLDATFALMRSVHPLLALAPAAGRVVIVGSKNVPAPGPGAAAYSASKAAVTQLARIAALEWGDDRIRVNVVHPNAVFDTGLWTPEVLQSRADHYGMTVQQYKTHNVLHVEVTSHDVGELVAELCGPLFAKTTGAQLPIDGGNDRVI